ncbi:MAG: ABC transporter ATP-binding protein [Candidatus Omnitrophota bacterium]|jgi:iron complex transport system ATP-binding protein
MIQINNLSAGYYTGDILHDITLEITKGDFIGIIGPNGSGKTTLLRVMSRALKPRQGSIQLNNRETNTMGIKEFCQQAAFVAQDTAVNFSFTAFEIVLMGRIPHQKRLAWQTKQDLATAHEAMLLTDTETLKNKRINELSSGERQRVFIAKALAQEPKILFLDEPTSHLDIGHQIQILDMLKTLNQNKSLTIVIIMHDLNLAAEYCNRLVLLDHGKIFTEGSPEKVLTYQTIESVYKTVVVVDKNPINKKPYVLLVSATDKSPER